MMQYEEVIAWWQSEKKDSIADIYTLLDNFRILFAYHSGKIENEAVTLYDTREISLGFILKLHHTLMQGCCDEIRYQKGERPGEFKKHDYVTGDGIGAYPEDVEQEVKDLLDEIKESEGKYVLIIKFKDIPRNSPV